MCPEMVRWHYFQLNLISFWCQFPVCSIYSVLYGEVELVVRPPGCGTFEHCNRQKAGILYDFVQYKMFKIGLLFACHKGFIWKL